jgi:hypothetical protein
MTEVRGGAGRSWWGPRWRDLLALVAVLAVLTYLWIAEEFGGLSDRLLLIGPFDDMALRALLLLVAMTAVSGWIISRCWAHMPLEEGVTTVATDLTACRFTPLVLVDRPDAANAP